MDSLAAAVKGVVAINGPQRIHERDALGESARGQNYIIWRGIYRDVRQVGSIKGPSTYAFYAAWYDNGTIAKRHIHKCIITYAFQTAAKFYYNMRIIYIYAAYHLTLR